VNGLSRDGSDRRWCRAATGRLLPDDRVPACAHGEWNHRNFERDRRCGRWYAAAMTSQMNEVIFLVEAAPEGGHVARALGLSIFVEADTLEAVRAQVRDAVRCHFEEDQAPKVIRLHFARDEVISA
jgi:hypothetical protein